ncbi:MAG: hypothetical protein R3E79_18155 [Caldilineaceae bacterium]
MNLPATDQMLQALQRAGIDIRPAAMEVTWDEVTATMHQMRRYVQAAGLWYTIIDEWLVDEQFVQQLLGKMDTAYKDWN